MRDREGSASRWDYDNVQRYVMGAAPLQRCIDDASSGGALAAQVPFMILPGVKHICGTDNLQLTNGN